MTQEVFSLSANILSHMTIPEKEEPERRVLIVDDEASVLRLIERILRPVGFEPETFGSPAEALLAFEADRYVLALLDIESPGGMDGIALAEELRARAPGLPIVMMSGNEERLAQARQAGFEDVLPKPFSPAQLVALLCSRAAVKKAAKSVLVIEDDFTLSTLLSEFLQAEGYVVSCTADGGEGLSSAMENSPALAIVDIMLPGRHGFEVCRCLRRGLSGVKILVISGKIPRTDLAKAVEYGADKFLMKPFSQTDFLVEVRALIG